MMNTHVVPQSMAITNFARNFEAGRVTNGVASREVLQNPGKVHCLVSIVELKLPQQSIFGSTFAPSIFDSHMSVAELRIPPDVIDVVYHPEDDAAS